MGGTGFISEDGKSFVSMREEETPHEETHDDNKGELNLDSIDVSSFPEEHQPLLKRIIADVKDKTAKLGSLSERADIADALKQIASTTAAVVKGKESASDVEKPEEVDLFKDVKFEDGDYYQKYFKSVFQGINQLNKAIKGISDSVQNGEKESFINTAKRFVKENKLPKEVVLKMDEIAKELGPGVYKNLPLLSKMAKLELGIKDEKPRSEEKIDDGDDNPASSRKRSVEMSNRRKGQVNKKPVTSMADAWDKAEEELTEE